MELLKNKKSLTPSLIIPKTISYFAKTLELISSKLASFFGIRLFITPVNFPIPKREQYMLKSAQKKRLQIPEIKKEIEILSPEPIAMNVFMPRKVAAALYKLVAPKECPIAASKGPNVVFIFSIVFKNSGIIVVLPVDFPCAGPSNEITIYPFSNNLSAKATN